MLCRLDLEWISRGVSLARSRRGHHERERDRREPIGPRGPRGRCWRDGASRRTGRGSGVAERERDLVLDLALRDHLDLALQDAFDLALRDGDGAELPGVEDLWEGMARMKVSWVRAPGKGSALALYSGSPTAAVPGKKVVRR